MAKGCDVRKTQSAIVGFADGGRCQKPGNVGSLQTLGGAREHILSWRPHRNAALPSPKVAFRHLALRTVRY